MAPAPTDPRPPGSAQQQPVEGSRALTTDMREAVVARLSAAFAHDALTIEEFERRVGQVYRVTTAASLAELVADLPRDEASARISAGRALAPPQPMAAHIGAFFSNVERASRLAVPPRLMIRTICGNIELDLRNAEFGQGVTEISVEAVLGNVEVKLPAHVAVENHGGSVMGSFAVVLAPGAHWSFARANAAVRITGRSVMSNVEFVSSAGDER